MNTTYSGDIPKQTQPVVVEGNISTNLGKNPPELVHIQPDTYADAKFNYSNINFNKNNSIIKFTFR
jgi:hypothetical protein